jgi:probable phosphoglycerate mutase
MSLSQQAWPALLWIVRHGESAGNVARDAAEHAGQPVIDIADRDMDVPLSGLGERQARALGNWFGRQPPSQRPNVVLTSPYRRAQQTAMSITEGARDQQKAVWVVDERLREKEFGSLNLLTKAGILARFPAESELRAKMGKFYYRPPGGESWCDVLLRLRSVLDHIQLQYAGERVLIVSHQVVVLCFRYLLERMDEAQILAIDREHDVANCGITSYALAEDAQGRPGMTLACYNFAAPLEEASAPVTKAPDAAALR